MFCIVAVTSVPLSLPWRISGLASNRRSYTLRPVSTITGFWERIHIQEHPMIQLRVSEIANELIGLFNQQSEDLDSNGALDDWTQLQLDEYEHRRDRIRRLAEELTRA
jgi:hypothetical protein